MRRLPSSVLLVIGVIAALFVASPTQAQDFGGPIDREPNARFGCEAGPRLFDQFGNFGLFNSGTPDCTWWQMPTFGGGPTGYVPRRGRITGVQVRTGPNPAPLRFTVVRTIIGRSADGRLIPNSTACCFGEQMSPSIRLQPNRVNNVALNLPIRTGVDLQNSAFLDDSVGISATSGSGFLPVSSTKNPVNSGDFATPGNAAVQMAYPQIAPGQVRTQTTSAPSHVIHTRYTVCFNGAPRTGRLAAKTAGSRCGAQMRTGRVSSSKGKASLPLKCTGSCKGKIKVVNPNNGRALAKKRSFSIGFKGAGRVKMKLNGAGKRATKGKRSTRAKVVITSQGETTKRVIKLR